METALISLRLETEDFLSSSGQLAGMVLLVSMLLSFAFIRFSTRMIRAEVSWWPGNVTPGGLHIHHLVFGIVAMMIAGFLGFAVQPAEPWLEVLAAVFGIGMGLTLDEFALWLYLEDVYWAEEGRRSVDAVIFAAIIGGALVLGLVPVSGNEAGSISAIALSVATTIALCIVAAMKGKLWCAISGMFVPLVAIVAAIRVARPESPFARRFYPPDGRRMTKARERDARYRRRWLRLQDAIGGTPHLPSPRRADGED